MISVSEKVESHLISESKVKPFWIFWTFMLLVISLSLHHFWSPSISVEPLPSIVFSSTEIQHKIDSWRLNYPDLSQARNRHNAFRDLTEILQQNENAAQEAKKAVLLNNNSSMELLAVTVGVLSSQGTSQAQQVLCDMLQAFPQDEKKVMLVLPQIMLIEQPQALLFDELQAFIRKSHNSILRENAELTLAGLSQHAYETNQPLAQRITLWLEGKKAALTQEFQSLPAFLDLLGNTGNETFLPYILKATTYENAEVRARATFALRLFNGEEVVETLEQLATDQDSGVKTNAIEVLSYFRPSHINL
jgi:HEAT repeats